MSAAFTAIMLWLTDLILQEETMKSIGVKEEITLEEKIPVNQPASLSRFGELLKKTKELHKANTDL